MFCPHCGKENRDSSHFCRHCGGKLATDSRTSHWIQKIPHFKKISRRAWIVIVIVLLLAGATVYAAPKANDYFKVSAAMAKAKELQANGDYAGALALLNSVESKWTFRSVSQDLNNLKDKENSYIKDQNNYNLAISEEGSSTSTTNDTLKKAQSLLQSIPTDFPQYSEVQTALNSLQSRIEGQFENQTQQAQAQAQAAQAAKAQAQAQAAQAAQEKATAQAQAQASAQAAANAQVQAQQAALQKSLEVEKSFRDQLVTAYNVFNNVALSSYTQAIQYSNNSNDLLAISSCTSVATALNSALNSVSDLNSRFTGLPTAYYGAVTNMISAINNLNSACNLLVQESGTTLDYSSSINSYKNNAISYETMVKAFLDANSLQ